VPRLRMSGAIPLLPICLHDVNRDFTFTLHGYEHWSLSVSQEQSMRVWEQSDQDLKQRVRRVWRNLRNEDFRNLHVFVILSLLTTAGIRSLLYSRRSNQGFLVRSILLSNITCLVPNVSLINSIGPKATDILHTEAVFLFHIPQVYYFCKSFTFCKACYTFSIRYVH
jgi:hypothetical protein